MIRFAVIGPRPDPYPDPAARIGEWPAPGPMARPRVLLLEPEESSGGVLVYRYAADGEFAGDDWYLTIEDARAATRQEFGGHLGEWQDYAGSDLNDAIAHALTVARAA